MEDIRLLAVEALPLEDGLDGVEVNVSEAVGEESGRRLGVDHLETRTLIEFAFQCHRRQLFFLTSQLLSMRSGSSKSLDCERRTQAFLAVRLLSRKCTHSLARWGTR